MEAQSTTLELKVVRHAVQYYGNDLPGALRALAAHLETLTDLSIVTFSKTVDISTDAMGIHLGINGLTDILGDVKDYDITDGKVVTHVPSEYED